MTPSKEVTMPSSEVKFPLQSNVLSEVQKAAAVIGAPDMVLEDDELRVCLLYTSPSPRDVEESRMPSSA